jgi:hypothetical protein
MKKQYKLKFHSADLQTDIQHIMENFHNNPENLEDSLPNVDYIKDNGEGNETWILDVRNTEDSYFYANQEERDADYATLMQLIDLIFGL